MAAGTRTINSAMINSQSSITVASDSIITASVNVTTTGNGGDKKWKSTAWRIADSSGSLSCKNHSDFNSGGTTDIEFDITAPSLDGTYNLYLIAYSDNNCSNGPSTEFELSNAVIISNHSPTLEMYLAMDESLWASELNEVLDGSGSTYSGQAFNGADTETIDPAITGNPGTCRFGRFDGTNDYVAISNLSDILNGTSSLSFWIRTTQTGNNVAYTAPGITGTEQNSGVDDIFWGWLDASGNIGISAGDNVNNSKSTTAINDGIFHHIVLSRNASTGAIKIYIDGSLNKSGNTNSGTISTNYSSIGRIENTSSNPPKYFDGDLDEVKVFDTELTLTDVQALMAETHTCPESIPFPIAEYRFDACSLAQPVEDSRGSFDGIATDTETSEIQSVLGGRSLDLSDSGTTDWVTLPKSLLNSIDDFSFSVWVKTDHSASQQEIFHALGSGTSDDELELSLKNNDEVYVKVRDESATLSSDIDLTDNIWHHVLVTREDKKVCLYVDGLPQECENNGVKAGSLSVQNDHSIVLGQEQDALRTAPEQESGFDSSQSFKGFIDELKLYQNILTSSDISTLYANEAAGKNADGSIRTIISCSGQIDHFELNYPSSGLTCLASPVTFKACANSDCSALYLDDFDITLAPSSDWLNNPVTISAGTAELELQHIKAEAVVLSISNSSVTPTSDLQCFENNVLDSSCDINFSEAGFIFDVPTLTSCKPQANVIIKAVKMSDTSIQCVSALTGSQPVNFRSIFSNPVAGNSTAIISGVPISGSLPGTAVNLIFGDNGEASFTAQYDDAGEIQLDAVYNDSNGLILSGTDQFVATPVALAVYSTDANADCASSNASCSLYRKAGESFNLKVNAACWTDDADTDFTDNPVTPNFELSSITTTHNLLAPSGGVAGGLSNPSFNFTSSDSGSHTLSQSVSEVGIFEFSVLAPSYFGESITVAASPAIGRFYPDHFKITALGNGSFNSACTSFSYSGQSFNYQTAPQLTVTAYSTSSPSTITQNYTGDFAKLASTDFSVVTPTTDATQLGADGINRVQLIWSPMAANLTDNNNGSLTFEFGNDNYRYLHQANSAIAEFTNAVDLTFTAINDSDGIGTQALPQVLQASGETIRFGRLAIASNHGSELVPLPINITAEYFNGLNWVANLADQCTTLNLTTDLQVANPQTASGSWQTGNTTMTISSGTTTATLSHNGPLLNGQAMLTLSAPGEDNIGYDDIRSQLSTTNPWLLGDYDSDGNYDDEPTGRASFGLFKGSDNIIFRRELY